MIQIASHTSSTQNPPVRIQEYAVGIFDTLPTKSALKKAIKKGLVYVNGIKANTGTYIYGNETISLYALAPTSKPSKTFDLALEVLFEDEYLAVINKPAGIVVSGNSFATINNALPQNLEKSTLTDATVPRPVHRLDYPTSGALLIGKTTSSIIQLNALFEKKNIQKTYHAIAIGSLNQQGSFEAPIDSKNATTQYRVLQHVASQKFNRLNLVELRPSTGRKHQLRKHLFANNTPILGDKTYFLDGLLLNGNGLYLHASTLEFIHPFTSKPIKITAKLPKKFTRIFPL